MTEQLHYKNAILLSLLVLLLIFSAMLHRAYNTEAVYIELNDSIAVSVNRMGNVINCISLNSDNEETDIIQIPDNTRYPAAIETLLDTGLKNGILNENDKVPVKIWVEDSTINNRYDIIEKNVKEVFSQLPIKAQCSAIDTGISKTASSYGISVGKYRMICEMQKLDPSISIDVYKDYSLKRLRSIYSLMLEGVSKNDAENANNASTGSIIHLINKVIFESEQGE